MKRRGFTLIELLIVVAIIGILAAIAIPNFLQAQVRAKVARAQSEFTTLGTALEVYRVDNNVYVYDYDSRGWPWYITDALTTPIDYISQSGVGLVDPFRDGVYSVYGPTGERFRYVNTEAHRRGFPACPFPGPYSGPAYGTPNYGDAITNTANRRYGQWRLSSAGPDRTASYVGTNFVTGLLIYDPTNGTVSNGDIARSQKEGLVTVDPNS